MRLGEITQDFRLANDSDQQTPSVISVSLNFDTAYGDVVADVFRDDAYWMSFRLPAELAGALHQSFLKREFSE